MSQRAAIASGNWSNPAIWNGAVLPEPEDIVASNTYTVTIDQNINVDRLTNAATTVVTEVPVMTSNTTPGGVASNSGTGGFSGRAAFLAFNGDVSNICYAGSTTTSDWVAYEFTTPKIIGRFGISYNGGTYNITYGLEAWDGSTWISIGTHNATGGSFTSPAFVNTTAYIKYRVIILTAGVYTQINEVYFYDALSVAATAGGGFILNDGVTVTTVNGIQAGNTTCLTYSGSGTSTILGNINPPNAQPSVYTYALVHNGSGTLNITGNLNASNTSNNRGCLLFTGSGVLNVIGNIFGGFANSPNVNASGTGLMNVVGNINGGSNVTSLNISGLITVNITGDIGGGSNSGRGLVINSGSVTVTGNLVIGVGGGNAIMLGGGSLTLIGNIGTSLFEGNTTLLNAQSVSSYVKVIGTIFAGGNAHYISTGSGAINILTGPFISSPSGIQPIYVTRMHYQRTIGSYYEFRDNSTLGALPPSPPAPATRLVSPDTVADSPIPRDVRQGVVYAEGSQTGTMIVPSRDNVAKGVLVDNTTGTAILDADSIWAVPLTSINTLNSIGRRVKNAATVESTGAQIQTTLNDNE